MLEEIDAFREPIPVFNIRGKTSVSTRAGGLLTICIFTVVIMFAIIRFEHMMSKYNPNINDYYVDLEKGQDANLNEANFRIAFTVEDYYAPHQLKDDDRYVRWLFRVLGKKNGVYFENFIPYHKCTEADYSDFFKIEESAEKKLNEIKSDPSRDFLCLDWDEEEPFVIYGTQTVDNYSRLEMILLPCNAANSGFGNKLEVDEHCEASLEEQIKYVGQSQVQMLVNKERFMPQ